MSSGEQSDAALHQLDRGRLASVTNRRVIAAVVDVWFFAPLLAETARLFVATPWSVLLGATVATALLAGTEAATGQTPGKGLTNIRVESLEGRVPEFRKALGRRAWMPAQALVAILDPSTFLAMAIVLVLAWSVHRDPHGRGWHDQVAGTQVVFFAEGSGWFTWIGVGIVAVGLGALAWQVVAALSA